MKNKKKVPFYKMDLYLIGTINEYSIPVINVTKNFQYKSY